MFSKEKFKNVAAKIFGETPCEDFIEVGSAMLREPNPGNLILLKSTFGLTDEQLQEIHQGSQEATPHRCSTRSRDAECAALTAYSKALANFCPDDTDSIRSVIESAKSLNLVRWIPREIGRLIGLSIASKREELGKTQTELSKDLAIALESIKRVEEWSYRSTILHQRSSVFEIAQGLFKETTTLFDILDWIVSEGLHREGFRQMVSATLQEASEQLLKKAQRPSSPAFGWSRWSSDEIR